MILILSGHGVQAMGGISGGGGDIIPQGTPTEFASPEQAKQYVELGAARLKTYLEKKSQAHSKSASSLDPLDSLFDKNSKGQDIFDILTNTRVDIKESSACLDSAGHTVDGSSVMAPDSICLSAMTIAQKVNADEIPEQAAALMMHEFTERLGFDDAFAVEVQSEVLQDLEKSEDWSTCLRTPLY